jgi:hypothetical protein
MNSRTELVFIERTIERADLISAFSAWGGKACGKAHLTTNRRQCQIKTDGELEKLTCNPVEQEEIHEKGSRRS